MGAVTRSVVLCLVVTLGTACDDGKLDAFAKAAEPSSSAGTGSNGGSAGSGGTSIPAGGTATSGGGGGSGGAGEAGTSAQPTSLLIDDFENGDTQSLGSQGWWYVTNDGTGTQSFGLESVTDRPSGTHALRTRGQDFTDWGAALGLDLDGEGPTFDVSPYDELRFSIRSEPGTLGSVDVTLLDSRNIHFGYTLALSDTWQDVVISISELVAFEEPTTFDPQQVTHLQFFMSAGEPFDVWIDDVALASTPP